MYTSTHSSIYNWNTTREGNFIKMKKKKMHSNVHEHAYYFYGRIYGSLIEIALFPFN